jgi:hypothetical protein
LLTFQPVNFSTFSFQLPINFPSLHIAPDERFGFIKGIGHNWVWPDIMSKVWVNEQLIGDTQAL